jgi:hypothetical protein
VQSSWHLLRNCPRDDISSRGLRKVPKDPSARYGTLELLPHFALRCRHADNAARTAKPETNPAAKIPTMMVMSVSIAYLLDFSPGSLPAENPLAAATGATIEPGRSPSGCARLSGRSRLTSANHRSRACDVPQMVRHGLDHCIVKFRAFFHSSVRATFVPAARIPRGPAQNKSG